jgi:hypothetical protein
MNTFSSSCTRAKHRQSVGGIRPERNRATGASKRRDSRKLSWANPYLENPPQPNRGVHLQCPEGVNLPRYPGFGSQNDFGEQLVQSLDSPRLRRFFLSLFPLSVRRCFVQDPATVMIASVYAVRAIPCEAIVGKEEVRLSREQSTHLTAKFSPVSLLTQG